MRSISLALVAGFNPLVALSAASIQTVEEANASGEAVMSAENPKQCFDDGQVGKEILRAIDWQKAEARGGQYGEGKLRKTTTAHSFVLEGPLDEYLSQFFSGAKKGRYQFSISVNVSPTEVTGTSLSAAEIATLENTEKLLTQMGDSKGAKNIRAKIDAAKKNQ